MKKFTILLNYLGIIFLLVSCSGTTTTNTPFQGQGLLTTPSLPPLIMTEQLSTHTPTHSLTPTHPTVTATTALTFKPTSTAIPTVDPITGLRTQCLEPVPALPEGVRLEGKLVLGNKYLLDLGTGKQTLLAQDTQDINWLEISPNRKWMYYSDCGAATGGSGCVDTVASLNEVVSNFPHHNDEWMWEWWLDNDRLFIIPFGTAPSNSVIVLNPFSGEEIELSLDLPDPYYSTPDNIIYFLPINLDPTLTRAMFFDREGIGRLIMWDIPASKMLAWLPYPVVPGDPVFPPGGESSSGWSPDGSKFATTSPVTFPDPAGVTLAAEELFSLSLEGQVRQLTHLSEGYKFVRISGWRWSPDNSHIAFWLQTAGEEDPSQEDLVSRLVVLDTETQEVTDYCIGTSKFTRLPVWSPDGQQLIVNFLPEDGSLPILILIDLKNSFASIIAEDVKSSLVGWMVEP